MLKYVIYFFLVTRLEFCDILQEIIIVNKTNYPAKFRIVWKDNSRNENFVLLNEKGTTGDEAVLIKQWGCWTKEALQDYISDISRIDLITQRDSIAIKDKKELFSFLVKRRIGIYKNVIKIKLE